MSKTSKYVENKSNKNKDFSELVDLYKELLKQNKIISEQQDKINELEDELNIWKHYH